MLRDVVIMDARTILLNDHGCMIKMEFDRWKGCLNWKTGCMIKMEFYPMRENTYTFIKDGYVITLYPMKPEPPKKKNISQYEGISTAVMKNMTQI